MRASSDVYLILCPRCEVTRIFWNFFYLFVDVFFEKLLRNRVKTLFFSGFVVVVVVVVLFVFSLYSAKDL